MSKINLSSFRAGLVSMVALALVWAGVAIARPGPSHPLQVDPVDPYESSALFTSDDVLAEAQADLDGGIDFAILLNALEVDHRGGIYSVFHAEDRDDTVYVPNTDLQASQHSGIAYWDGADVRILASTSWVYEGVDGNAYDEDLYVGGWMPELERVPALGAGASGPLAEGDVVALRWWNDDPDTRRIHSRSAAGIVGMTSAGVL